MYTCPSRRPGVGRASDYVGFLETQTPHRPIFLTRANNSFNSDGKGLTLTKISGGDGTSNTIMFAHKGMSPRDYQVSTQNMGHNTWWAGATSYGHAASEVGMSRLTSSPQKDAVDPTDDAVYASAGCAPMSNNAHASQGNCRLSNTITGSPHDSMPVLLGDGSVRALRYGVPQATDQAMIFWQDGVPPDASWLP